MVSRSVVSSLSEAIGHLDDTIQASLGRQGGLGLDGLISCVSHPQDHSVHCPQPVESCDIVDPGRSTTGEASLLEGDTAVCIYATAASLRRIPGPELSLLSLKLLQSSMARHVWVVVPPSILDAARGHLVGLVGVEPILVSGFETPVLEVDSSLRLKDGSIDLAPCGDGDMLPALRAAGVLDSFGGRHIALVDACNALGGPSPSLVGEHLAGGAPVTCEVVRREMGDRTPVLCDLNGYPQLAEPCRLSGVSPEAFSMTGTGCLVARADLNWDTVDWAWHRRRRPIDGVLRVTYSRSATDLTSTFQTRFLAAPREQRYLHLGGEPTSQEIARIFEAM